MTTTRIDDELHVRLLSIFYYILGGLKLIGSCLPLIYLFVGASMLSGPLRGHHAEAGPALVGGVFVLAAVFLLLACWVVGVCMLFTGYCLSQRKNYTFCVVIAAIECLFFPVGTVLGVFSLIVLLRPSVKGMFEQG